MHLYRLMLLRSFKTRPVRAILSTFGIILGVASILAIGITNQTALNSVTRLFAETSGKANLIITAVEGSSEGFSERNIRKVNNIPGVEIVVPTIKVKSVLADEAPQSEIGFNFFGASMGGLTLHGVDPVIEQQAHEYVLLSGRFLQDDDAYELVLVKSFAEENKIQLNNWVEILTPNGRERVQVIGIIDRDGAGQTNNGDFGVLPIRVVQKLFNRSGSVDQMDIVAEEGYISTEVLEQLKTDLENRLGKNFSVTSPASQGKRMNQMLGSYQIGLNFLSGIALFVGAFLIYNAFAMTVVERTREFGMLRTVGMTSRQVTTQVLIEALLLGLVGSLLGALLGIFLSRSLTGLMGMMLNQDMAGISIPIPLLITGLIVGIVVTMLAAVIPALQAGKISPLEALRVRGIQKEGWLLRRSWRIGVILLVVTTFILVINPFPFDVQFRMGSVTVFCLFFGASLLIPASVTLWERLSRPMMRVIYGNSGRLGSSNIQRSKVRTTLTVAALMIGVAMILIVRGMTESFSGDLSSWIDAYMGGDLYVSSSVSMRDEVKKHLESVDGVAAVAPIRYLEADWRKPDGVTDSIVFMGIDPSAHSQVTSFVFSDSSTNPAKALQRLAEGNAVFVSSVISEKFNLKTGDKILLNTKSGYRPFEIAAVVVDFYNQGQVVQGNWNDMRLYFRVNDANAFMVKAAEGYSIPEVEDNIDALYGKRDRLTIESNVDLRQRVSVLMNQAFSMFDVLALVSMVVAALGVVNTLTMNVMERTQEIGMLRGVGMTRSQVVSMILAEAALMGLIGGILGLVIGVILSRIFFISMNTMSGYNLTYVLPMVAIFAGVVLSLVISQLAAIFPARRAATIRILDAIHYE